MDQWIAQLLTTTMTTMLPMPPHSSPLPNQQTTTYLPAATPPRTMFDLEAIRQQVRKNMDNMDRWMAEMSTMMTMMTLPHSSPLPNQPTFPSLTPPTPSHTSSSREANDCNTTNGHEPYPLLLMPTTSTLPTPPSQPLHQPDSLPTPPTHDPTFQIQQNHENL